MVELFIQKYIFAKKLCFSFRAHPPSHSRHGVLVGSSYQEAQDRSERVRGDPPAASSEIVLRNSPPAPRRGLARPLSRPSPPPPSNLDLHPPAREKRERPFFPNRLPGPRDFSDFSAAEALSKLGQAPRRRPPSPPPLTLTPAPKARRCSGRSHRFGGGVFKSFRSLGPRANLSWWMWVLWRRRRRLGLLLLCASQVMPGETNADPVSPSSRHSLPAQLLYPTPPHRHRVAKTAFFLQHCFLARLSIMRVERGGKSAPEPARGCFDAVAASFPQERGYCGPATPKLIQSRFGAL